jgi:hypothetical protein
MICALFSNTKAQPRGHPHGTLPHGCAHAALQMAGRSGSAEA